MQLPISPEDDEGRDDAGYCVGAASANRVGVASTVVTMVRQWIL